MRTAQSLRFLALTLLACFGRTSFAAIVYQENFDANHTADWVINASPGDQRADFFFDYSSVGIPAAPNSGGTTRGLKLQANVSGSVFGGVSVSPRNQTFSGDYRLRFDMWLNYNGPLDSGFVGSTQLTGAGIGTNATEPEWASGPHTSVHFGVTGDGDVASDYRVYSSAPNGSLGTGYPSGDPVFTAPTRDNTDPYYSQFGNQPAPDAQVTLFPQQTGVTPTGTQGFAWHDVIIDKIGDRATFSIDGLGIATVDLTTVSLSGGNILFNHYDINSGSSSDPNAATLLFGLIDNVRVEDVIPEPSSMLLCTAGASLLLFRRRRDSSGAT